MPALVVGKGLAEGGHLTAAFGDLPEDRAVGLVLEVVEAEAGGFVLEVFRAGAVASAGFAVAVLAFLGVELFARVDRGGAGFDGVLYLLGRFGGLPGFRAGGVEGEVQRGESR